MRQRQECIVLTAPLDQRGPAPREADRVARQAEPSTVSLAGLLTLAQAFQTLPTPPERLILFLAASGGAPGQQFWGSHFFTARPPCQPVLSVTIDLGVGRPVGGDTAVLGGLQEVELAATPAWVAAAHPELELVVADGGSVTWPHSDASVFSRRVYPSLVLQRGPVGSSPARDSVAMNRDGGGPTSSALDFERTARLTPLQALQSATLNPAKMLQATDSLGTVAAGQLADLVLVEADPLADITNTTRIRAVEP